MKKILLFSFALLTQKVIFLEALDKNYKLNITTIIGIKKSKYLKRVVTKLIENYNSRFKFTHWSMIIKKYSL